MRFFFQLPFCIIALSNVLVGRALCDDQMILCIFCGHFSKVCSACIRKYEEKIKQCEKTGEGLRTNHVRTLKS